MRAEANRSCFVSFLPRALTVTGNLQTNLTKSHFLNSNGRNFICEGDKTNQTIPIFFFSEVSGVFSIGS